MSKLAKFGIFGIIFGMFAVLLIGFISSVSAEGEIKNGEFAWKVCGSKAQCVKVQKIDKKGNWQDNSPYGCNDKVYGSFAGEYRAVCSGTTVDTIPRPSEITKSAPVAAVRACTPRTGSWSEVDPINGEGCGRKIDHVCPGDRDAVENRECNVRVVNFEVTSCSSCDNYCGPKLGVCYAGELPNADLKTRFFGFGNLGCDSGQQCYCYNDVNALENVNVNIVSTGICASESANAQQQQLQQQFIPVTERACSDLASSECDSQYTRCKMVNQRCADYSPSSTACSAKPLHQCQSGGCVVIGGINSPSGRCISTVGNRAIVDLMPKILEDRGHVSDRDRIEDLKRFKNILEEHNIDYPEYLAAFDKENARLGAGISRPAFRATGQAVKINTADEGCPDFVSAGASEGIVDYDDFFAFVDVFGKAVDRSNKKFDLEKDDFKIIGLGDFFKFADNFGKEVECFTPEMIEVLDKQGECRDGVCSFKLKAVGKYDGEKELNVNIRGGDYNEKTFLVRIAGSAVRKISNLLTGSSVFDITGFAVGDAVYQDVTKPSTGKSRFECGLQLNPGFCCPAGYATSSDGSRCVLAESLVRYCADFNLDNRVDFVDYFYLADNFGAGAGDAGYDARVDLDNSGDIGFDDFFLFADEFGEEPECG